MAPRMPVLAIPHGGGPCFQLPDGTLGPPGLWTRMRAYLESIAATLPAKPTAILVVSAHYEAAAATVLTSPAPPLLFDYYEFPPEAYLIHWPAPGATALAGRVTQLMMAASITTATDAKRGFDHGVFVPLQVAFPAADVPTTQLSLLRGLSALAHVALGRALAPLRDEGVLIIASGMTFHDLAAMRAAIAGHEAAADVAVQSEAFDAWLTDTLTAADVAPDERLNRLEHWADAPHARACHPRAEHLMPLLVAAGAGLGAAAVRPYSEALGGVAHVSAFAWQ